MASQNSLTLRPPSYSQEDFFIADIFDSLSFKDDMASMEHPIFSLSKVKDFRQIEYKNGSVSIVIAPSTYGLPTIFDKDILLYCGSLIIAEINKGNIPPKTVRISTHDLIIATKRTNDGRGYRLLKEALKRLKGVSITTNIKTNKRHITKGFGLIDDYTIIESSRVKDRMVRLEITLSDWFYNSLIGMEILSISRDYFRLGKSTERRLYEIARKHCGRQKEWKISLETLYLKTGSTSPLRKFRFMIREIVADNHLPEYTIALLEGDIVLFTYRDYVEKVEMFTTVKQVKDETLTKARLLTIQAGTGWDFYALYQQFQDQLAKGFNPRSIDGAFLNFIKKKIKVRA